MKNIKSYPGHYYRDGRWSRVSDVLAVEVALSISINGTPFTVTMQTPGQERDLVRGLLYGENVYRDLGIDPAIAVTCFTDDSYISAVEVTIPPDRILKDFAGTRNVISASSCGMCGKTKLDDEVGIVIDHDAVIRPEVVGTMFDQMAEMQQSFQQSGGTHAAGLFALDGEMLSIREDIGRHNAVDKVIGDLLYRRMLERGKCLTVSGRISYEIVSKARAAGIPYLASVSAPSTLAVDEAQQSGMTLMAFCRNHKLTVYSNPQHVLIEGIEPEHGPVNKEVHV